MRGVIPGQGNHGRGFSGTEKAAEYRKFSHILFSLFISLSQGRARRLCLERVLIMHGLL
jgi:hypothetical protein